MPPVQIWSTYRTFNLWEGQPILKDKSYSVVLPLTNTQNLQMPWELNEEHPVLSSAGGSPNSLGLFVRLDNVTLQAAGIQEGIWKCVSVF